MSSDEDWDMVAIEKLEEEKEEEVPKEIKIEIGEKKEELEIEKVAMEIEKKVDGLDKNKLLEEEEEKEEEEPFCLNCVIPYLKGCKIS
tara:strand:+ start:78 stop:341 length:264 start_codon:yes stop_codon:yes gene_type:complete